MAVVVFDLDMTVIDSSHRHAAKPDGSIDLAHWFENATPEKIAKDTLLPLARMVRTYFHTGHKVVLCTSRAMQAGDFAFLEAHSNELPHHALFYRQGYFVTSESPEFANSYHGFIGDCRDDGEIKLEQVQGYIETLGFKNFISAAVHIFEDNEKTMDLFRRHGARALDARKINKELGA